jgi:hypothetical protein
LREGPAAVWTLLVEDFVLGVPQQIIDFVIDVNRSGSVEPHGDAFRDPAAISNRLSSCLSCFISLNSWRVSISFRDVSASSMAEGPLSTGFNDECASALAGSCNTM